jgi:hypothetical protein
MNCGLPGETSCSSDKVLQACLTKAQGHSITTSTGRPGEHSALLATNGIPTPSPKVAMQEKMFWTELDHAKKYQQLIPPEWGPTTIWEFPNKNGLGRWNSPWTDRTGPVWSVPNDKLGGIGPGWFLP